MDNMRIKSYTNSDLRTHTLHIQEYDYVLPTNMALYQWWVGL